MPKMLPPGETIWWVPKEHAATADDLLKAATLYTEGGSAKAVNISCAIAAGYTLGATESDTDDTRTICDVGNVQTPTIGNYEASITFFREALNQDGTTPETTPAGKAWKLFKNGIQDGAVEGWLVKRIGFKHDKPVATGHELSAFLVIPDNPQDVTGDGTTPIQFTVSFMPQGQFFLNKPVKA